MADSWLPAVGTQDPALRSLGSVSTCRPEEGSQTARVGRLVGQPRQPTCGEGTSGDLDADRGGGTERAPVEGKIQPALLPDEKHLTALLGDLEDKRFTFRDKAIRHLERWAELAAPALRQRLDEKPPLESRLRIKRLLEKMEGPITSAARLQELRAVVVLEHAETSQAVRVLERLANGGPKARLTLEAKAL